MVIPKASAPHQRSKDSNIRYALDEFKFLHSPHDLQVFCEKMAYLMPRALGTLERYTPVPPSIQVEPTNCCNLACVCCPSSRSSRQKGYMDWTLFQKIIDNAARIGVQRVRLFLHGEPTLHPQIVEMIGYTKSKGLAVHLTTNGMPLTQEKVRAILHSGVDLADHITFSMLGHSKRVHENTMKGVRHDRVLENIFDFLELRIKLQVNGPVYLGKNDNLLERGRYPVLPRCRRGLAAAKFERIFDQRNLE